MCPGWENPGRAPGGWDMGSPERAAPSGASLQGSESSLPPSWEGQQECSPPEHEGPCSFLNSLRPPRTKFPKPPPASGLVPRAKSLWGHPVWGAPSSLAREQTVFPKPCGKLGKLSAGLCFQGHTRRAQRAACSPMPGTPPQARPLSLSVGYRAIAQLAPPSPTQPHPGRDRNWPLGARSSAA